MSIRAFVGLGLLAALATPAFAGPPDCTPGKMVLDEVADGLPRYHASRHADSCDASLVSDSGPPVRHSFFRL
jgi:hypothetical protein